MHHLWRSGKTRVDPRARNLVRLVYFLIDGDENGGTALRQTQRDCFVPLKGAQLSKHGHNVRKAKGTYTNNLHRFPDTQEDFGSCN